MRFSSPKKFLIEDFPEEHRAWLETLFNPLNTFLEQTSSNLEGGLTLKDNFKSIVTELDVVENQTYPMKINTSSLNKARPLSIRVGKFRALDGTTPTAGCTCYWVEDESGIKVTLFGLDSSKKYKITLIIEA